MSAVNCFSSDVAMFNVPVLLFSVHLNLFTICHVTENQSNAYLVTTQSLTN